MSFPGQTSGPSLLTWRPDIWAGDEEEILEIAAMAQIRGNLNEQCVHIDEIWVQRDLDVAAILNMTSTAPVQIERPQPSNFFIGARPSLIGSPPDFWPSITTRAVSSRPSREQMDTIDVFDVQLSVEVLCKAGPVDQQRLHQQEGINAEGAVNKQVKRLTAAVHNCLRLDPTLGRMINGVSVPTKRQGYPTALPGNTLERTGPYWLYCGILLQYTASMNSY